MFEGARGKVKVVNSETKYEHGKKITPAAGAGRDVTPSLLPLI